MVLAGPQIPAKAKTMLILIEIRSEADMKWKLGIDTGGSYTDAVLVDCSTDKIISKSKAATTKENLAVGIENAIDRLHIRNMEDHICLICLSTTLATNAVIEGKGAAVGLITIDAPRRYYYPVSCSYDVKGKIDVKGCELSPLDIENAVQALEQMKGKVEALAISGYASVRNPVYERKIKDLSEQILGVPVVCAHELTNVLGYYERTITATLNAKLIPIIKNLITAAKEILKRKGIHGTLVVIKGDGNCMVDSFAEERPIETILSGPAASALGGMFLSNQKDMIIADMGGTTLDIVPIFNRKIPIEESGAVVGRWKTRVKAMHSRSFGLGGDSYIRMDNSGNLTFGPERVVPLCVAAQKYPKLTDEIRDLSLCSEYHIVERQEVDCIMRFKSASMVSEELESEEKEILSLLQEGPHSLLYLGKELNKDIDSLKLKKLLDFDLVQMISLTPTDLLHAAGEYTQYHTEISQIAVYRLAKRKRMNSREFIAYAEDCFTERICSAFVESLLLEKGIKEEYISDDVVRCLFDRKIQKYPLADFSIKLNVPIVGIGAPAKAWFKRVEKKLNCQVIVPENNEVANAVGTVAGGINESLEALIRYDFQAKKYIAHLPDKRATFETLKEAAAFAEKELMLCGRDFAKKLGIQKYSSCISKDKIETENCGNAEEQFVELRMRMAIAADAKNISH